MNKKESTIKIIVKVYKSVLEIIPIQGIIVPFYYMVQGVFPAFITMISASLFDNVYNYIESGKDFERIVLFAIILLTGYSIQYIFRAIVSIPLNAGLYEKCSSFFRLKIAQKLAKIPLVNFENPEILNMKNRAQECVNREDLSAIFRMSSVFITNIISTVSVIIILINYHIWFLPISFLSVIPYFINRMIRGKEFYKLKYFQANKIRMRDYLFSLFTQKETVKEMRVMNFDSYIMKKWENVRDDVNEELWKFYKNECLSMMLCDFIRITGYAASIILSFILVINGELSIGVFGASIVAFSSVQSSIRAFLVEFGRIPEHIGFAKEYYNFLDIDEENDGEKLKIKQISTININNVSFNYPNSSCSAIKNVSLDIRKNETIAIIGENGSGKTTLSKLLLGIYKPTNGKILYNNQYLNNMDKAFLYKKISVVAQNFIRYKLSFRENIAISNIDKINEDEDIIHISLTNDINVTDNIDQILSKEFNGIELSGGQWQKIAIARAMFKNHEMIILDEPTSALDPIIETEILDKFIQLSKNKISIIISHRVGVCTKVDRIIVMKKGRIVEIGNHEELLKKNGEYSRLFKEQRKWYV
ncbi:MAG: ABC transporter ATP-binding protein/permease [Firmicutes bacterium]|nr:ABC transporter ATP-binding protein/permease [Bacillota bacterium]